MNGYELSREWFDWCFENPSKAKPSHTAVYFWMIELCNRMGWKNEFGIPALYSMEATGISSKNTYYKSFHDLEDWGFIKIIEKAKNQNTPNIISIVGVSKIKTAHESANKSALDSAVIQQASQHEFSGGNIDKPKTNKQINKKPENGEKVSALDFLKKYFIERLNKECGEEIIKVPKADRNDLEVKFNAQMEIEISQGKIKMDADQLVPRFKQYILSWIQNQKKYENNNPNPGVNTRNRF